MSNKKSRLVKWLNRKFSNRQPKEWKTRKIAFVGVLLVWLAVITIGFGKDLNDTLINNIFSAGKWVIATGCSIVIAGNITKCIENKGNVESEDEEL